MSDDPVLEAVNVAIRFREEQARNASDAETDRFLCEVMEKNYAKYTWIHPLTRHGVALNGEIAKQYHEYCTEIGVSWLPLRLGVVATFLGVALEEGASRSKLTDICDAISHLAELNQCFDPTSDPLIEAILNASGRPVLKDTEVN